VLKIDLLLEILTLLKVGGRLVSYGEYQVESHSHFHWKWSPTLSST